MKFKLEIQLGNDAMSTLWDVQLALKKIASELSVFACAKDKEFSKKILDENGNTVGKFGLEAE
jgi:hypothetical protein